MLFARRANNYLEENELTRDYLRNVDNILVEGETEYSYSFISKNGITVIGIMLWCIEVVSKICRKKVRNSFLSYAGVYFTDIDADSDIFKITLRDTTDRNNKVLIFSKTADFKKYSFKAQQGHTYEFRVGISKYKNGGEYNLRVYGQ